MPQFYMFQLVYSLVAAVLLLFAIIAITSVFIFATIDTVSYYDFIIKEFILMIGISIISMNFAVILVILAFTFNIVSA